MTFEIIATYAAAAALAIGGIFALVAAIGLVKFNDSMTRMHAPTKVGTIGIGSMLLASMIHAALLDQGWIQELLIMAFLFVTAPISANFIAKVNMHKRACMTPPPPPRDDTWATFNVPEADREIEMQDDAQIRTN